MAVKPMTTAVCWDLDANVSASYAHTIELFYFCPCCLEQVVAAISTRKNYFFRAKNSHKLGCVNEKDKTQASAIPGRAISRPAYIPPPLVPSHLGALPKRRKRRPPSIPEMKALVSLVQAAPAWHPGTLAQVVDAWASMSVNERHQTPLWIAGQPLTYFSAFVGINPLQKSVPALGCGQLIVYAKASVSVLSNAICVVTWLKFNTQKQPVPIREILKPTDPAAVRLAGARFARLFLHGPVPTINSKQTYFEMQTATRYTGCVVVP